MTRRPLARSFALALPLTLVLGVGCEPGSTAGPGSQAPAPARGNARHIREIAAVAAPTGEPARSYGVDRPHPLSDIESAILTASKASISASLEHDPALSAMVRDLAATSPSRFDMPPGLLDGLMAWHGVGDPQPAVVVVELQGTEHGCDRRAAADCGDAIAALVEEVARTVARNAGGRWRLGVGVTPVTSEAGQPKTRMMVGVVERAVELAPVPVVLPSGGTVKLDGRLLGRRSEPRIERVDPRGDWARLPAVVGSDGSLQAQVPCDAGDGPYQVEILANGELGPEVVANLRVFCGVGRPAQIRYSYERLGPRVTEADIVRGNFDLLNEVRRARGLPMLAWDDRAARVAWAHSADMAKNGFVGHVSPTTGDASARFDAAGITGTVVRENVARGYGPKGIHESLMNSPGHRANLVAPDITHVGIGVVFGPPESGAADAPRPVFLTQNFYAKRGADAPARPAQALRGRIDDDRRAAGLAPLGWYPALGKLAQQRADAVAGLAPPLDDSEFQARFGELGLKSIESHQVGAGTFASLATLDLWRQLDGDARIGIGVAQIDEGQGGGLVMIVLVGR